MSRGSSARRRKNGKTYGKRGKSKSGDELFSPIHPLDIEVSDLNEEEELEEEEVDDIEEEDYMDYVVEEEDVAAAAADPAAECARVRDELAVWGGIDVAVLGQRAMVSNTGEIRK